MNKLYRHLTVLFLCLPLLLPVQTMADAGAHAGISVGQATLRRQSNPDETAFGYKLFAGLHATGPFSVEISHVNLGEYFEDTSNAREISGNALHLVGKLPFTPRLAALAKVGLFSWDVEYNNSNTSTTGTDATYGFALTYILLTGQTLRFEWEHYADVGKVNTTTGNDMTLATIGISISF